MYSGTWGPRSSGSQSCRKPFRVCLIYCWFTGLCDWSKTSFMCATAHASVRDVAPLSQTIMERELLDLHLLRVLIGSWYCVWLAEQFRTALTGTLRWHILFNGLVHQKLISLLILVHFCGTRTSFYQVPLKIVALFTFSQKVKLHVGTASPIC